MARGHGGKRQNAGRPYSAATLRRRPQQNIIPIDHHFARIPTRIMGNSPPSSPARPDTKGEEAEFVAALTGNSGEINKVQEVNGNNKKPAGTINDTPLTRNNNEHSNVSPLRSKQKFSGILREAIDAVDQMQALNNAQKGILWKRRGPDFVIPSSIPQNRLTDSWKAFYCYDVFTWRPDVIIPGWKPRCVSCRNNDKVNVNSFKREPRLVYGLKANYLLNSPVQWYCLRCQRANATSKTQYTFHSHDPPVLEQLKMEYPGIYSLFPCEMGWRSAVDNDLLELMFTAADSGMGPSSVREFVKTMHFYHFQQCELRWLQFLCSRKSQPAPLDVDIGKSIRKLRPFPAYDSDDVCGMVPSQSLLCDMYCKMTGFRSQRMDAMHQRRVRGSKRFCLDASYKVPKWLANFMGEPMYSALITMVNEYGESLASYFALSDNHDEIKSCLLMLRECGFEPEVGFTDNVPRDDCFLQDCLPSLKTASVTVTDDASIHNLPVLRLRSTPQCFVHSEEAIAALDLFEDQLKGLDDPVLSFDLEWSVYSGGAPRGQVAVFSVAALSVDKTIIIHLAKIRNKKELLNRLAQLVANKKYLFVGSNIKNDLAVLKSDFPTSNFRLFRYKDLGLMAVYRGLVPHTKGHYGLKPLTRKVLRQHIPEDGIRTSKIWNSDGSLPKEAIEYAARDVEAGVLIYDHIKDLPDLSARLQIGEVKVGLEVDILPRRKTVVDPIARGRIIQIEGSTITGIKLSLKRVLVQITEVLKPESGLLYTQVGRTKCKCGAVSHERGNTHSCDLRTFQDALRMNIDPFVIVEEYSRLRHRQTQQQEIEATTDAMAPAPVDNPLGASMDLPTGGLGLDLEEKFGTHADAIDHHHIDDDGNDDADDDIVDLDLPPNAIKALDIITMDDKDMDDDKHDTDDASRHDSLPDQNLLDSTLNNATANQVALAMEARSVVARLIADADALAMIDGCTSQVANSAESNTDDKSSSSSNQIRRVLGDTFHVMDRVRVPVHHDWKAAYFSALREAIFMYDLSDKMRVEKVLHKKGKIWDDVVAYNFSYIGLRVRRRVPPPKILHARVKAVFDYFENKKDSKTGKPLFGARAREMAKNVLAALLRGEISDPQIPMYVPYFTTEDTVKKDKDGLLLWRCLRGTGPAESAHSQYTRSFGQVRAGPMYSVAVLRNHHHRKSWRASAANRPGFPQHINHYDCELVDSINQLYHEVFEATKYDGWPSYDEATPTKRSPFGIIPLIEDCGQSKGKACEFLSPQLQFLAEMMGSRLPYTPIAKKEERILFKKLLEDFLNNGGSISQDTFHNLCETWNTKHVNLPSKKGEAIEIFPKYVWHIASHYKKWRVNNKKRAALEEARENNTIKALSRNRGIRVADDTPFQRAPLVSAPLPARIPQAPLPQAQYGPTSLSRSPLPLAATIPQTTHNPTLTLLQPPSQIPQSHILAQPPQLALAYQPLAYYPGNATNTFENQERKRKRKLCSFCRNTACNRPWNKSKRCNE